MTMGTVRGGVAAERLSLRNWGPPSVFGVLVDHSFTKGVARDKVNLREQKGISPELCATFGNSRGKKKGAISGKNFLPIFLCLVQNCGRKKKNRAQPWYARKSGKSPGQKKTVNGEIVL